MKTYNHFGFMFASCAVTTKLRGTSCGHVTGACLPSSYRSCGRKSLDEHERLSKDFRGALLRHWANISLRAVLFEMLFFRFRQCDFQGNVHPRLSIDSESYNENFRLGVKVQLQLSSAVFNQLSHTWSRLLLAQTLFVFIIVDSIQTIQHINRK